MKNIILESLNKIRELEKPQTLTEALSAEEVKELQALQKELSAFSSDPDVSAALAQYSKVGAPTGGAAAQPAAKKAAAPVDPKALENAKKLKLDSPEAIKSYQKMQGLTPDGIIGPKTAAALAKSVASVTPDQSDAETKRLAAQSTSGQGASPAGDPIAVISKAVPQPKMGMEYWVNGSRYKFTLPPMGQGDGRATWIKNFSPGDWGWNKNQAKASAKYTGPDSGEVATAADAAKPPSGQAAQPATKPGVAPVQPGGM